MPGLTVRTKIYSFCSAFIIFKTQKEILYDNNNYDLNYIIQFIEKHRAKLHLFIRVGEREVLVLGLYILFTLLNPQKNELV